MANASAPVGAPLGSATPQFEAMASRGLTAWLHETRLSLGFTTYQAGK